MGDTLGTFVSLFPSRVLKGLCRFQARASEEHQELHHTHTAGWGDVILTILARRLSRACVAAGRHAWDMLGSTAAAGPEGSIQAGHQQSGLPSLPWHHVQEA